MVAMATKHGFLVPLGICHFRFYEFRSGAKGTKLVKLKINTTLVFYNETNVMKLDRSC